MGKNVLIVILVAACVYLASVVVEVENQRYALQIGMCKDEIGHTDNKCLAGVETRTGWWWHLFYAITD
jgi:hypothetical protein